MTETQASINEWVEQTFGPSASLLRIATRANEEMAELLHALSASDYASAAKEVADTIIVLCRLSQRSNFDLIACLTTASRGHIQEEPVIIAARANQKLASLMTFLTISTARPHPERIGDIGADLKRLSINMGFNLCDAIDSAMQVNREREWTLDGTGCGYHRREQE